MFLGLLRRYDKLERNCCGSDVFDPSMTTPTCDIQDGGGGGGVNLGVVIGSVAASVVLLCACLWICKKACKKDRKPGSPAKLPEKP